MKFFGIQKLTLLDYPEKVAATLFTGGCNFRCPFCHNASLVISPDASEATDEEEVLAFLKKRVGLLDGVCITGGEPLLATGLEEFAERVKAMGFCVKLDTNGSFPARLRTLCLAGLVDYVAMDIKNSPDKYGVTVGIENFDVSPVMESARFLLSDENPVPFEFRTTVADELHTEKDFEQIAQSFRGAKNYYLQNFSDSGDIIGSGLHPCSKEKLQRFADILGTCAEKVTFREIE